MSGTMSSLFWQLSGMTFLLLSILLAAVCISSSSAPVPPAGNANISATSTLPVTTSIPIVTSSRVQNPQENASLFIGINSNPHHYLGDIITFNGTTNLPVGENISLAIYTTEFIPCPKSSCCCSVAPCCGGISDAVTLISGDSDINTWSWDVNTSEHGFRQGSPYVFSVSGRKGLVENSSLFSVWDIPKPNITINVPENASNENAIRLYGMVNTGNGPDEKLSLKIFSDSGARIYYIIPVVFDGAGYHWNFTLKKSAITPYNYYNVNITSMTDPKIGIYRTFNYNNEPGYWPFFPQ